MAANHITLLQIIQKFALRTGTGSQPINSVIGNVSADVNQLQSLLEEECDELSQRFGWEGIVNECTYVTALSPVEDQGQIDTLATNGFNYIVKNTFWDRTQRLPIIGPLDAEDWQSIHAIIVTGPRYQWRFRGTHLLINPAPAASHLMAFEYVSKNWCNVSGSYSTFQNFFSNDSDLVMLPDNLVLMGLRWRYKKEKRLAYAEDFDIYEAQVANAMTRNKGSRTLHMDDRTGSLVPGVWVPPGSWPLS